MRNEKFELMIENKEWNENENKAFIDLLVFQISQIGLLLLLFI